MQNVVITLVEEVSSMVNSIVVADKKNLNIRNTLDTKDLNKAIKFTIKNSNTQGYNIAIK